MRRRTISIVVCVFMLFSFVPAALADSGAEHLDAHWAAQALQKWSDSGLLQGYPDGTIRPDQPVTRAEIASLINTVFGFAERADGIAYADIDPHAWYAESLSVAVAAGYINGYPDGSIRPHQPVTRQETAVMISRLFELPQADANVMEVYADGGEIASFARDAIGKLAAAGILRGLPDRTIRPNGHLTRAEAVTILDRLAERVIHREGDYDDVHASANVIVSQADVTLQGAVIGGDLILTAGVGEGDVTLNATTVEGTVWIYGGGQNSVYVNGSNIGRIVVDKPGSPVRVVVNDTSIQDVEVRSASVLEIDAESDVAQMSIQSSAGGTTLAVKGDVGNVDNEADDVILNGEEMPKNTPLFITDGEVRSGHPASGSPGRSSGTSGGGRPGDGNPGNGDGDDPDEQEPGNPPAEQWTLVWSDEFDGSGTNLDTNGLDLDKWGYQHGTGAEHGLVGWGNDEQQYYRAENVKVEDGKLIIEARNDGYDGMPYTSGRLWTSGAFAQKYGKFEARIKLPEGEGFWPAFWMMPQDDMYGGWAASGEIDIMEARGRLIDHVGGTIHYGKSWPNNKLTGDSYYFPEGESILDYHTYSIEWEPGEIRWYVDGNLYQTLNDWYSHGDGQPEKYAYPAPFDQEFYMILNLAVGGTYDGNRVPPADKFPARMEVDYVRVYELTGREYREPAEPEVVVEPLPEDAKPAIEGNYVHDTGFEQPIADVADGPLDPNYWNFVRISGTQGAGSISVEEMDGQRLARIDVTNGGTADYAVQLIQNVTLGKGRLYKVSFDAKSAANRSINVKLGGGAERGWAIYSDTLTASLRNELQHYELTFQMLADTDTLARLEFNVGLDTNSVWIGNVKVEETEVLVDPNGPKKPLADGNHVYNGTFDLGSMDRSTFWNTAVADGEAVLSVHPDTRELAALITSGGSGPGAVELKQTGINLLQSDEYVLTFDARADEPRTIEVQLLSEDGALVFVSESAMLSTVMSQQTVSFRMPDGVTDERSQLVFRLGGHDVDVYLDNVRLIRTTNHNADYTGVDLFPLKNGDFALGYMFWEPFVEGGAAHFTTVDGAAGIAVAHTGGEAWHIMLNQSNMSFAQGFTYKLAFDVQSSVARDIEVTLENAGYTRRFDSGPLMIGPSAERYEFTFKPALDEQLALKFLLGKTASSPSTPHDIMIDNVVLEIEDAPLSRPPVLLADAEGNRLGQPIELVFPDHAEWRAAIHAVNLNGSALEDHLCSVSPGTISIDPTAFPNAGRYEVTVKAHGFADSSAEQMVLPVDGNLILNGGMDEGLDHWQYWAEAADWSALAHENDAARINIYYHGGTGNEWSVPYSWSTQLYQQGIALQAGRTYELSFRAWASVDRPIQIELGGYNGNEKTTYGITGDDSAVFKKTFTTGSPIQLDLRFLLGNVEEGGLSTTDVPHTIYIDDVKLAEYIAPLSLSAPPVLTAEGMLAEVGQSVRIAFADDEAWRRAITDIVIDGVSVTGSVYEPVIAPELIVLDPHWFTEGRDYEIRLKADGFADAVMIYTVSAPPWTAIEPHLSGESRTRPRAYAPNGYGPEECALCDNRLTGRDVYTLT